MIWFFCGLILGIALAILVLVIEIYLKDSQQGMAQIKRYIEEKTKVKGEIIMPVSDSERSAEEKIKHFESLGRDTPIDEIL